METNLTYSKPNIVQVIDPETALHYLDSKQLKDLTDDPRLLKDFIAALTPPDVSLHAIHIAERGGHSWQVDRYNMYVNARDLFFEIHPDFKPTWELPGYLIPKQED